MRTKPTGVATSQNFKSDQKKKNENHIATHPQTARPPARPERLGVLQDQAPRGRGAGVELELDAGQDLLLEQEVMQFV